MFQALSDMMKTPVTILPYVSTSTSGDKVFGNPINTKCVVEPRTTITRTGRMSKTGDREQHEGLLYVSGDTPITKNDHIIFNGEEHPVQRLWADYEGEKVSMWLVYF